MMTRDLQLRLFVYGTLKRGFSNHRRLCRGLVRADAAEIRGKLYDLPAGYPALLIPEASLTFAVRGICDKEGLCFQQTDCKGLAYNRSMPAGKISGWSWILGGG
jgi:gamma-glutamylcyclotransferase (GGCT)/AIG2-like uncharacterized protein YtfP